VVAWVVVLVGAYGLGAIPFGLIVGRTLGGVDPRTAGSGNIGATNVARTAGLGWGIATFVLDFAKGAALPFALRAGLRSPMALESFGFAPGSVPGPAWLAAAAGGAAIAGHVFSVFLRFRGGKGVATAAGVFAALAPVALAVALLTWGGVVAASRVVAVGSLAAVAALVGATFALGVDAPTRLLAVVAAGVIFGRHTGNLRRLWAARREARAG